MSEGNSLRLAPPQAAPESYRQRSDWPRSAEVPAFLIGPARPAAVLAALTRVGDEWHVVYIRRARNERDHHSGQVAFPGGRYEHEDGSLERAALREAHEEIGLEPRAVKLLGRLAPYQTITNYLVTPVVGTVPAGYPFEAAADEVGRVFTIPLRWLSDPANYSLKPRKPALAGRPVDVVYYRRYDGELLWGATARMTLALIAALRVEPR